MIRNRCVTYGAQKYRVEPAKAFKAIFWHHAMVLQVVVAPPRKKFFSHSKGPCPLLCGAKDQQRCMYHFFSDSIARHNGNVVIAHFEPPWCTTEGMAVRF